MAKATTSERKTYKKESVSFRDPGLMRKLRAAARRKGLDHLTNTALVRLAITSWCRG